ncbi:MAG: EAL domain-containing response regulator [Vicinamibacteria bacterium]|nr:EAL domain-containing response regulator [Vicinamibacteria bacterium]
MAENTELRILVLDDELLMLKLHAQMLSHLGFSQVSTSQSGQDALEKMDAGPLPPDLILLDLSMPAMDGIEFIRRLVDRKFGGRLILVTGEEERVQRTVEKLAEAHQIRVLGHLSKPVEEDKLATLLRRWRPPAGTFEIAWKKMYSPEAVRQGVEGGELTVHYEPKVAIQTGEFVGVEALVRWRHPKDGLVVPQQFVSVAEANGLIYPLTRFVFSTAMSQSAVWRAGGLSVKMAVNVSVDALSSLDFAGFAHEQATRAGVPPKDVIVEVTESRLMQDLRAPLEVLTRLHLMRFQLSIDDFGTGYSSLTQLQDIPFSELKIDRSFVHRGSSDQTVRTMYQTCLGLAKQLKMTSVAEGVEDRNDWDFVLASDCETAQGYFIGRAMPPEAIFPWAAKWRERVRRGFKNEG